MSEMINNDPKYKQLRRKLRKEQTPAEAALWQKLRNSRFHGYKFYRQFGVSRYILDFYCEQLKLAIELDGGHHAEPNYEHFDKEREKDLNALGVCVIRFWNNEVLNNINCVLEKIEEEVVKRELSRPSATLP